MSSQSKLVIESDALKANLLETAVEDVFIDPSYGVLLDIAADYKGILNNLNELLYEVSHPFRNWNLILPRLRAFVLKNCDMYRRHERGPEAFAKFSAIFFAAIDGSKKNEALLFQAIESFLAYADKLISSLEPQDLPVYEEALASFFTHLHGLDEKEMMYVVQGHHPVKKISLRLLDLGDRLETTTAQYDFTPLVRLMKRILSLNYQYWLKEDDPLPWFTTQCGEMCRGWEAGKLFNAISHNQIRSHFQSLGKMEEGSSAESLRAILTLPSHMDIVRFYKQVPEKLLEEMGPGEETEKEGLTADRFSENRKLLFLFRIMETAGLFLIHEETLREINRSLVQLIRQQTFEEIERFLLTTFKLLKRNVRKYPHTSLQCIQVLGTEVFNRGNSRLVEAFLWESVRFGFQYANVSGVNEDWQPIANPAHLANIRVWLNLIMQEPKWCATLFSALIINIKLTGTCIKDTDLFQKDISKLLNHPIGPVYNLVKQFAKLMPVFFNEIGAEGLLRDVSTDVDEIHNRQDKLIHFLRKQSHVESSNLIVDFIEAIFAFWKTRDKSVLVPFLPQEVLRDIKPHGPYVNDMHRLMQMILRLPNIRALEDLLEWEDHKLEMFLATQKDIPAKERQRFRLMIRMYNLLHQKYNLGLQELRHQLEQAANSGFAEMEQLLADLEICDTFQCLAALLDHLENLKEIILSEKQYEAKEDIYFKRHIAVDIPSVYGRYREKKFDALGLTFRLENLANIYLEKLPATINLSFITKATFNRIIKCLNLYLRALRIDGISSRKLETYLSLLSSSSDIKRFSYTQYIDIIRGLSEGVKDVIYAYYTNIHQNNLSIIIPQIGYQNLLPKFKSLWQETGKQFDDIKDVPDTKESDGEPKRAKVDPVLSQRIFGLSESFMRDLIAGTFGLQLLDNFITRIYQTLEHQKELLDEKSLDLLMTYNPDNAVSYLHKHNQHTNNLIHLGNKGYNLAQLAMEGKPIPPGFIITTEIYRCWPVIKNFSRARNELMNQIRQSLTELERATGRRFGDPENPLLLSVRSGAAISMPGMMATIHNVGLNQEVVQEFAKHSGKEYLAWDNYRRFLQSWAMSKGVGREVFQKLMNGAKKQHGVTVKKDFTPEQMKELALNYQKTVRNLGIGFPDDPWLQLTSAVELVLDSWNTHKTREYRSLMDVSESWGTAVIVQVMVFGNLSQEAGSGVSFTAHPYRKVSRVALWGDYAPGDQGEDIVSGLVTTHPVSVEQAEIDGRSKENSLELRFPEVYNELLRLSRELVYEKSWNPQEIEFTFEGPKAEDLYILQTRDMITIKKKETFHVFEESAEFEKNIMGKGIGVSGSALSGRAVFTADNIKILRQEDPGTPLILIRQDTVPEDIKEISMADGLLTARGGQTSHASVVALRLDKTCVVGCDTLKVFETREYAEIGNHVIKFGDPVSIDGRKGLLIKGMHQIKKEMHILPM